MYDWIYVTTPLVINEKMQKDDRASETLTSCYKSL